MFDGMVQRRNAVNHNSAAYEEHRQRSHHRQALHQPGRQHQQAFADASCHRARLFFQPVANIVQLDDQSHQTVHAHGDQNRDAGENQDLIQERRVRDNPQRNRDDFCRQNKVGTNGAFDLIALEGFRVLRGQRFKTLLAHLRRIALLARAKGVQHLLHALEAEKCPTDHQ